MAYFYAYFAAVIINLTINTYLPVYFFDILNVDRTQLAFVQFISYLFAFTKPVFAVFIDKKEEFKGKRIILIIISMAISMTFIVMILSLRLLILFGFLTGANFALFAIIDVTIDKLVVEDSTTKDAKNKNAFIMMIGGFVGTIAGMAVPLMVGLDNLSSWSLYFIVNSMFILLLIPVSFIIKSPKPLKTDESREQADGEQGTINPKNVLILFLFGFLIYSSNIFQYPFEPWVISKYFNDSVELFSMISILLTIISLPGYIGGLFLTKKISREHLFTLSALIIGVMLIIGPFLDVVGFLTCVSIYLLFNALILVVLTSAMIQVSKRKVLVYQVIAVSFLLSKLVFVPTGTFLSSLIDTEFLLVISGVLYLIGAVIVLIGLKLKDEKKDSE
jgi:MFS family permease